MKSIKDQWIVITGASSGIGRSAAFLLAAEGARLILVSRNEVKLRGIALEIYESNPNNHKPLIIPCDISNENEVKQMVKTCINLTGGIDILINNAGIGIYGEFFKNSIYDIRQVMDVNFFGAIHCINCFLPYMKKKGMGQIINIASVAALHGIPYLGVYSASKAALASLSQSLRAELYDTNIQVKVIYPGYTDTNFFVNEKKVGSVKRPEGPYESPEYVARAILRVINSENKNYVMTLKGKLLSVLNHLFPGLVDFIMKRYAMQLNY